MGNKSSLMLQDEEIKRIADETGFSAQQIEKLYTRFTHLDRSSCGSLSKADLMSIPELAINPLCERLIEIFFADCRQPASRQLAQQQQLLTQQQQQQQHQPQQQQQQQAKLLLLEEDEERINFCQFMRVLAAFRSSSSGSSSANNSTGARSRSPSGTRRESLRQRRTSELAAARAGARHLANQAARSEPSALISDSLRDKLHFVFKIYDADGDGRISFGDLRTILKLMVGGYIEELQLDKIATRAFVEVDRDHDGFIEFREFCKVFAGKDMDLFRLSI